MGTDDRYERHIGLDDFDAHSQLELRQSRVLVVGVGGLGGLVAAQLTAAGVGRLTLCDPGRLERSNLNRQLFYTEDQLGLVKVDLLATRLQQLSPPVQIRTVAGLFDDSNAAALVADHDLVVDCLDNDAARFALNATCVASRVPLVHGGIRGWNGEAALLIAEGRPCLACLRPIHVAVAGGPIPVVAPAAGMIASLESNIALRHLIDAKGQPTSLFTWDGRNHRLLETPIKRNPACRVCQE